MSGRAEDVNHLAIGACDILTARFGETGQVSVHVYRPRTTLEMPATAGLAALGIRSMMRGTVDRDAAELAFAIESLGGSLAPSLGADVLGLGATVLSEHVAAAASLVAEVFHRPRLSPASIEIERALLLDDARSVSDDMVRFPVQLMLGVAFADTGYGSPALGTEESLLSFTVEDVRRWHATMLAGGRTTIIAVGDADPGKLAGALVESFGLSGARTGGRSDPSPGAQGPGPGTRLRGITPGVRIETRDRKQSALAMLFPGPARNDATRFAAETWGAVAAGLGGRMFESLRSKRSLAYTVIATSWQRRRAGGLLTYIATEPARLDEARDAMLEELAVFRREPPGDDEVSRARAMLVGSVEMSRQTAGEFAGEIADAWLLGSGLAELDDPAAPYRAVTPDTVHAVAAAALDPGARAEGVVAAAVTG